MAPVTAPFSCAKLTAAALPLWREAFGDADADILKMIELLAPEAHFLFAREGEQIVSQGIAIPVTRGGREGYYLYALATAPAYRGRGYLRALLDYATALAQAHGRDFLLLIPANAALAATYARHDFTCRLPLCASLDGARGRLPLPPREGERPARGEADISRAAQGAGLSPSLFRAVLYTMNGELTVTADGFCLRDRANPALALLCNNTVLPDPTAFSITADGECALCRSLTDSCLPPAWADPLPR